MGNFFHDEEEEKKKSKCIEGQDTDPLDSPGSLFMTSTVPLREKCCEVSMNNPFLERKGMAPLKGMGQYFSLWEKKRRKKERGK